MERKSKSNSYIRPMPKAQFLGLMRKFKEIGGMYICNKDSEEYLKKKKAEACTIDGYTIVFKRRPTRVAVHEELFHAKQYREGKIDGSRRNRIECEIEAQKYLLENAEILELSRTEVEQTKKLLKEYEEILSKLKGGQS